MANVELKGLKGLQDLDHLLSESKLEKIPQETIFTLQIDKLIPGKYQPRTVIADDALNELASSIQAQGIILPLIVRKLQTEGEEYEIIAGERRWRAAALAGLKTVPAIIRAITDETALAFALIENIQRESLNPMDEAMALSRLKDEFNMTHEDIAKRVGRSRSAVTNLLRLLLLHDEVKTSLCAGKIEMGHARALLALEKMAQCELTQQIIQKNLSVRETEKLVRQRKSPYFLSSPRSNIFAENIAAWQSELSQKLSSMVKINLNAKGKGKVIIQVQSPDEITTFIKKISQ